MRNLTFASFNNVTILGSSAAGFLCLSLLDASIKSLLLLVLATAVSFMLVRASAATRHWVWASTLIGLLLMPACAMLLPQWRVLPSWLSIESRIEQQGNGSLKVAFSQPSSEIPPDTWISPSQPFVPESAEYSQGEVQRPSDVPAEIERAPIRLSAYQLLIAWGTGFLLCLLPIALAFYRLIQLERVFKNENPIPKKLAWQVIDVAKDLGIDMPLVLIGPTGAMPMVWSFWKSRLFLPADVDQWTANRLNAVLLHEMIHLSRRDTTWFWVASFARAVNWFNPLAWYAVHRLRVECERACDDHVLRMGVDASEYAGHLLELATSVRAASGTGSLALAMASKPNVENRILSILNLRTNRCGVTLLRAVGVLTVVSLGVAALATLTATATDKNIAERHTAADQVEDEPYKYPYCVVEVKNLQSRSLEEAITVFNREAQESPTGRWQPPITEQETLDAIAKFVELEHIPEPPKATLREIVKTKTLPPNAYFRRFTRLDDEQQMQGVWWVRLVVKVDVPTVYSVPVRTTQLFTRPYTQMERQQNAEEGLTLINRFVSYFEEPPNIRLKEEFSKEAMDRMSGRFEKGIKEKDLEALVGLFNWQGTSDSTRDFVTAELRMLLLSETHSVKIEPRTFNGNLIHWSAYQHYQPNLDVIGYLEVEYTLGNPLIVGQAGRSPYLLDKGDIVGIYIEGVLPYENAKPPETPTANYPDAGSGKLHPSLRLPFVVQKNGTLSLPSIGPIKVVGATVEQATELIKKAYLDAKIFTNREKLRPIVTILKERSTGPREVLSLEIGRVGDEFHLANYVPSGERMFPKGTIEGLSIHGHNERLADGTLLMTQLISNPGSLISAHVANEEIRLRELRHKEGKNALVADLQEDERKYVQGKITEVSQGGDVVHINIGKADGLSPGVSFAVLAPDIDHVADASPKAKIQVVEVISGSEHLSRCKVLSIPTGNISKGDSIYSVAWQPGKTVGFALVGKMDIDGDGTDDREKVKWMIAEAGGLVTFDLPPDGKSTGELTAETRWLVIGQDFKETDVGGVVDAKVRSLGVMRFNLEKLLGWLRK